MLTAVGLALATLAIATPSATSEPVPIRIVWEAPRGCPDAASVAEDLVRLTHGAVATAMAAEREVHARVVEEPTGFTLELAIVTGDQREVRHLTSPRCETLARAAALMIAVVLAPVATAKTVGAAPILPPPLPAVSEPAPADPAPPRAASPTRAARPSQAWTHRAVLAAWVGPSIAIVPRVSAIVGGDLGWRVGPLGLQLSGWHTFAATNAIAPGVGVRAAVSGGGLRFVYAPRAGPVELPISVGLELGAIDGRGTGARVRPHRVRGLWSAVAVGFGLAWPARGRIALAVRADALIGLLRPGIHIDSRDAEVLAFRMPPIALRVIAGPMLRLP
jgi:hypothetical protein